MFPIGPFRYFEVPLDACLQIHETHNLDYIITTKMMLILILKIVIPALDSRRE